MAITGAIFNSLIYGGVDSADYGVYITGDAVFNAPKRSVELVSVPGRNGAIELDQGHFENIEVSYPAGMFGDDQTDFRERLSDFRNAIMSQKGYQRLSDTYHPDEFRMGIYVDGLEVEPKHYNEAGQFTLRFNCKPQRWLTSGEEPIDVMDFHGETYEDNAPYLLRQSAGGETSVPFDMEKDTLIGGTIAWNQLCNASSVTVPNGHKYYMRKGGTASVGASTGSAITGLTNGTDIVIDLTATFGTEIADHVYGLEQTTAGSGIAWLKSYGFLTKDYYAYNDGSLVSVKTSEHRTTGKNLLKIDANSATSYGVTFTVNSDGSIKAVGTNTRGRELLWTIKTAGPIPKFLHGTVFSGAVSGNLGLAVTYSADGAWKGADVLERAGDMTLSVPNNATDYSVSIRIPDGAQVNGTVHPMIRFADADASYEPYTLHSYPLGNDDLRGIFKLSNGNLYADGDVKTSDGQIQRKYGYEVFDGSSDENWLWEGNNINRARIQLSNANTGESARMPYLCNRGEYSQFGTAPGVTFIYGETGVLYYYAPVTSLADFKTWLSNNPLQAIFRLATPTTETADSFASPQIVSPNGTEEYVDERSVPVPVGHRTVYGMDPSVIVNPTLFDAGPLLQVKGYGNIQFNGYNIDLLEQTLGDVEYIAPGTQDVRSGDGAGIFGVNIGDGRTNPGDDVTIGSTLFECVVTFPNARIELYYNDPAEYGTNTLPGYLSCSHTSNSFRMAFNSIVETMQWSTSAQTVLMANYRGSSFMRIVPADGSSSANVTIEFMAIVLIDRDGTMRISVSVSVNAGTQPYAVDEKICKVLVQGGVEAYSSVPLAENTVYIDCEIGEAYLKNGEEVISVDRALDLGSDLPVLSPSANRIDYVGQFTELNIVPRWWKI